MEKSETLEKSFVSQLEDEAHKLDISSITSPHTKMFNNT